MMPFAIVSGSSSVQNAVCSTKDESHDRTTPSASALNSQRNLMDTLIDKITAFAHANSEVRAVILEGSLTVNAQVDELSDYDINIFAVNHERYLAANAWMNQMRDKSGKNEKDMNYGCTYRRNNS